MPHPSAALALRVALPLPLPREFDYLPGSAGPPAPDWIGRRVRVPFGRGEQVGVISALVPVGEAGLELKAISGLLDPQPLLEGELLESLRWVARYYHAPLGEVIATCLPTALRAGQALPETCTYAQALTPDGLEAAAKLRRGIEHAVGRQAGGEAHGLLDAIERIDLVVDDAPHLKPEAVGTDVDGRQPPSFRQVLGDPPRYSPTIVE